MSHQIAELEFIQSLDRAFLFSDVGTGKTPVLLRYAEERLLRGDRVLWVTEAGLIAQLKSEAKRWLHSHPGPDDLKKGSGDFRVTSFENLRTWDGLSNPGFDAVIVDEAGVLACGSDPSAPTYRAVSAALRAAKRSVLATATPVSTAHALDLYAILDAGNAPGLAPRKDFLNWVRFEEFPKEGGGVSLQPVGIRPAGLTHLEEMVRQCAIRTGIEEVDGSLPKVMRHEIEVALSDEDSAAYSRVRHEGSLRGHQKRQRASRSVSALTRATIDYLTVGQGASHTHAVVFTEHRDILDPLLSGLADRGAPVWEISGNRSAVARDRDVQKFTDAAKGILVGTKAMETGLNLQRASLLVTVVPSWTPAREAQREGRLRRHGSTHMQIQHVTIRPRASIEARKDRLHRAKDAVAQRIMDAVPRSSSAVTARRSAS